MATTMKVYAALQEVKLIQKKIEKAQNDGKVVPAAVSYNNGVVKVGGVNKTAKEYIAEQEAKLQSLADLRARELKIRAAIAEANCDTITVAGKPYTVYEAILLKDKDEVNDQRRQIGFLKSDYLRVKSQYDAMLEKAENEAYAQSKAYLEGASKPTLEEVKRAASTSTPTESIPDVAITVFNKFFDQNRPVMTEVYGDTLKYLNDLEDKLDAFVNEVDIKITEFNMTKEITIED